MTDRNTFQLPKDFRSRVEFRALEDEAGYIAACSVFMTLWGELAYLSETQRLGFISDAQADRMIVSKFRGDTDLFTKDPLGSLCGTQNLVKEEDGYLCPMFIAFNQSLQAEGVSDSERVGFMNSIRHTRHQFERQSEEQAIFFDQGRVVRPDGKQMTSDEFKQVLLLIKLVDYQYSRPDRMPKDYSLGLFQDAYAVLQTSSEHIIHGVCFYINRARHRKDLAIPERTEELLRDWDRFAKAFGKAGVMMRSKRLKKHVESEAKAARHT
jgi:hypothetical protein